MRTRRNTNMRNRRFARRNRRFAAINTQLSRTEIDVFAGLAADLAEDLASWKFDLEADFKDMDMQLANMQAEKKQLSADISGFGTAVKSLDDTIINMKRLGLEIDLSSISDQREQFVSQLSEMERELKDLDFDIAQLDAEMQAIESDAVLEVLESEEKKIFDQDDSLEGLGIFASAIAELLAADGGEEVIEDILGSASGEFLELMGKIGR